jgi:hypothetical protein
MAAPPRDVAAKARTRCASGGSDSGGVVIELTRTR